MTTQTTARPGRNEPCRCGSGKKYKHCCLEKDDKKAAAGRAKAAKAEAAAEAPPEETAAPAKDARAAKTLRNIRGAWVKEHQVRCDGARITEYQVNMMVTFVLDD